MDGLGQFTNCYLIYLTLTAHSIDSLLDSPDYRVRQQTMSYLKKQILQEQMDTGSDYFITFVLMSFYQTLGPEAQRNSKEIIREYFEPINLTGSYRRCPWLDVCPEPDFVPDLPQLFMDLLILNNVDLEKKTPNQIIDPEDALRYLELIKNGNATREKVWEWIKREIYISKAHGIMQNLGIDSYDPSRPLVDNWLTHRLATDLLIRDLIFMGYPKKSIQEWIRTGIDKEKEWILRRQARLY